MSRCCNNGRRDRRQYDQCNDLPVPPECNPCQEEVPQNTSLIQYASGGVGVGGAVAGITPSGDGATVNLLGFGLSAPVLFSTLSSLTPLSNSYAYPVAVPTKIRNLYFRAVVGGDATTVPTPASNILHVTVYKKSTASATSTSYTFKPTTTVPPTAYPYTAEVNQAVNLTLAAGDAILIAASTAESATSVSGTLFLSHK